MIDLSKSLKPAFYRLRLRLIVGGPNEGCCATYDWVRFVDQCNSAFLVQNPDWDRVRLDGLTLR